MPPTQSAPAVRLEQVSSARLLVGDGIIVLGLLNEWRHRIMATVFGVSRYDSNVLTLFVIAAFAGALRRAAAAPRTQVRKARSSPTAKGDTMIGAAVVKGEGPRLYPALALFPDRDRSFPRMTVRPAAANMFR
jgi:hypothetical protein